MLNETLKKQMEMFGLTDAISINFKLQEFASHDDIEDYLISDNYEQSDAYPGMCFAFSVTEIDADNVDVKLAFSGQFQDPGTQSIPS